MSKRISSAVLAVACVAALLAFVPSAVAAPDSPWSGSGTASSGLPTVTRVVADGSEGPAIFAYDNFAPGTGGSGAEGSWTFSTSYFDEVPETIELDYVFTGFHGFASVDVELLAFVGDPGEPDYVETLVSEQDVSCDPCVEPSGGFSYSGTVTLEEVPGGSDYGFLITGANFDSNARLMGRLIVDAAGSGIQEDTIVVNGWDESRSDSFWGLTESYLEPTRAFLTDPASFGTGGTVSTDILIADGIDTVTAESLLGTDVFFTGWVLTATISEAEKNALNAFVTGGGRLVATTDDSNHTMVDAFGLTQGDGNTNPSTFTTGHPISDGPFGVQTQFNENGSQGHYSALGSFATEVAGNAVEQVTIAELLPGALGAGSGRAVFVADVDFFTDQYTGGGNGATDNEVAIKNMFAYLAGAFVAPPPSTPGTAQILQAVPAGVDDNGEVSTAYTFVVAVTDGPAGETQTLEIVYSTECVDGVIGTTEVLGEVDVTFFATEEGSPDGQGVVYGIIESDDPLPPGAFVSGRFVVDGGTTVGPVSPCIISGPDNDSWTRALELFPGATPAETSGVLTSPGNTRWYKFDVTPGAKVTVELTGLPADYDLALFKDIAQTFEELENNVDDVDDLNQLSAEFAPSAFAPSAFAPSAFAPSAFAPSAFAPSAFAPSAFAPSAFAPSAFAPSAFAPSAFAPSAFAPSAFAPSAFAPSAFAPSAFAPSAFAPSAFASDNFTSAQTTSLLAVSAQAGTGGETVIVDTWNNTGQFYVRVRGKNGAFDPDDAFDLSVTLDGAQCAAVAPIAAAPFTAPAGGYETLIIADNDRIDPALSGNEAAELAALDANLAAYAARPEVDGMIVDLGDFPHIAALHQQADDNPSCPYAENLTADAIKDVIDAYRLANEDVEFLTLVGSDAQVPFFRYPDQALLGPEQDYDPPVADGTQSQSSLRLNYVLGQDQYGASRTLALKDSAFPVPQLAVGRIVESASDMNTVLTAYLDTPDGIVTPDSSLVTGYDFLTDAANAVQAELVAGTTSGDNDTLITPADVSPQDPASWTADQLRAELLGTGVDDGEDIVFLAGHFSANSALAADFETELLATELAASPTDLTNTIVFSNGCHSGYNIVDGDAVPGVTETVDWTQAFARKGATLVAGTGYQYGDTDFIEYSERIYVEFSKELRRGPAGTPVAVGDALVRAKQRYLATTPKLEGLHRKSVLISTVFGLPNLRVVMPGDRIVETTTGTAPVPAAVTGDPGQELGLQKASKSFDFTGELTERTVPLTTVNQDGSKGSVVDAKYLEGPDGVLTNPGEPALPLVSEDVSVAGLSLRGVGFRGGAWSESTIPAPLTGAPATEIRGVHTPFASVVNFPMKFVNANYFGALSGLGGTSLNITPAQHRVDNIGDIQAIRRTFSSMDVDLYYSANTQSYNLGQPALAAPPTITSVQAEVVGDDVEFQANVVGDLSAGIQEVWITYTEGDATSGTWLPLDFTQDGTDSTLWTATLPNGAVDFTEIDYVVHAVNGVGLVTTDDNYGAYYTISGVSAPPAPVPVVTALSLSAPSSAVYNSTITATATLEDETDQPVAGARILITLSSITRVATTNSSGIASVELPVSVVPGSYSLSASYAGSSALAATSTASTLTVTKSPTVLTLQTDPPTTTPSGVATGVSATVQTAAGAPLPARTVYFTLVDGNGATQTHARITDNVGRASLGTLPLAPGTYTATARFLGSIPTAGAPLVIADPAFQAASAIADAALAFCGDDGVAEICEPPLISVMHTGTPEGDSGSKVLEVMVSLSEPNPEPVSVDWEIRSALRAEAGVDFEAGSGTLTFEPGETELIVPVTLYGDTLDEGAGFDSEWAVVELSSPVNGVFGTGAFDMFGFVLIVDDDLPPVIEPGAAAVVEGDAGSVVLEVPVTLSSPSGLPVSVQWDTFATLQPEPGVDFEAASGTVTFDPGETTAIIPITVFGDGVVEPGSFFGSEWIAIRLTSPTNATLPNTGFFSNFAWGLIVDDD